MILNRQRGGGKLKPLPEELTPKAVREARQAAEEKKKKEQVEEEAR